LLIVLIGAVVIIMIKSRPYLFVGWFWYAITILPVIGIIQVGRQAMADRYAYLPLIGIGIMLAWGMPLFFTNKGTRNKILFPVAIACLAIWAVISWKQCGYWKNSTELFNRALNVTKENYLAHNNLGLVLFSEGKTEEAINHYNKAIRIMPEHIVFYNNRGVAYIKLGQYQRAIEDFNKAINLRTDYVDSYINRGDAYTKIGQYQLAIENYNKAINLKPDDADFYNRRGAVYLNQGNKKSGCWDAQKACESGNCKILEAAKSKGDCR
jgi:protein O-mannosyl-transferase